MSVDYFIIFGVLFGLYCVIRTAMLPIFQDSRDFWRYPLWPSSEPFTRNIKSIDFSRLSNQLQQAKQERQAQPHGPPLIFKKSLLVESRREELSRHGYFQKPPPPEAHEDDHGLTLQGV